MTSHFMARCLNEPSVVTFVNMKQIYANEPTRWLRYSPLLMAILTKPTRRSPRHKGRRTQPIQRGSNPSPCGPRAVPFLWSARDTTHQRFLHTPSPGGNPYNPQETHRPYYFQCYRHQHLPPPIRWLVPLLDYVEEYLWTDSEEGGDIWNGRWTSPLLESLLNVPSEYQITPRDFQVALKKLQQITSLLQTAQRAIYSARHIELFFQEARAKRAHTISLRRKRKTYHSRSLFEAWNIPYSKPHTPRRRSVTPL